MYGSKHNWALSVATTNQYTQDNGDRGYSLVPPLETNCEHSEVDEVFSNNRS